jgi:Glycogen recognition site of AMP-activated protein kinase
MKMVDRVRVRVSYLFSLWTALPPSLYFIWKWPGKSVTLWGSFNDWARGIPLFYDQNTSAHVAFVETIEKQGEFCVFKYFVDGEWKVDPEVEQVLEDDDVFNTMQVLVNVIEGDLVEREVEVKEELEIRYIIPPRLIQSQFVDVDCSFGLNDQNQGSFYLEGKNSNQEKEIVTRLFDTTSDDLSNCTYSDQSEIDIAKYAPVISNPLITKTYFVNNLDSESEYNQSPVDLIRFDEVIAGKVDFLKTVEEGRVRGPRNLLDSSTIELEDFTKEEICEEICIDTQEFFSMGDSGKVSNVNVQQLIVIDDDDIDTIPETIPAVAEDVAAELIHEQIQNIPIVTSPAPIDEDLEEDAIAFDQPVEQSETSIGGDEDDVITFDELVQQQLDIDSSDVDHEEDDVKIFDELAQQQLEIDNGGVDHDEQDAITFDELVQQQLDIDNGFIDPFLHDDQEDVITFDELVQQQLEIDNEQAVNIPPSFVDQDILDNDILINSDNNYNFTSFDSISPALNIFDQGTINFETLLTNYLKTTPPRPVIQAEIKTVFAHDPPVWQEIQVDQDTKRQRFSSHDLYRDITLQSVNANSEHVNLFCIILLTILSFTSVWWDFVGFGIEVLKSVIWCWIGLGLLFVIHSIVS